VDFNVNYTRGIDWGLFGSGSQFSISYRANYLEKFDETPVAGQPTVYECKEAFGNTCGTPRPEYQSMTRFTWTTGPMTASLLWRYLGESKDDRITNDGVASNTLAVPKIDDINYFDLSGSWAFDNALQGLQINMGVTNLTDEKPTKVGDVQEQSNTFPEMYDVIGRRFFVSATYKL
jgi:outer membrane receptor protein involved in Fe transport